MTILRDQFMQVVDQRFFHGTKIMTNFNNPPFPSSQVQDYPDGSLDQHDWPDDEYQENEQRYSNCLKQLLHLLQQIANSGRIPDVMSSQARVTRSNSVAKGYQSLFNHLDKYLETVVMLPGEYEYDEHLNVFIRCCKQLLLLPVSSGSRLEITWKTFRQLIDLIHDQYGTVLFGDKLRIQRRDAAKRYEEYSNYVDALFDSHARLIVLRLDLYYLEKYAAKISLGTALADLDRFFANMRNNSLFTELEGYIVKTEFGIERGIHFHLILFFNGARRRGASHVIHAREMGEYWSNTITEKRGWYWNCNAEAEKFESKGRLGIGLIHWSDTALRNNLLKLVLTYFFKTGQCFRSKLWPKARLIRRGLYPVSYAVKLGRPRSEIGLS
ncbi:hypothetical protein ACO0LB_06405 [Undibacterium sp. SXout7W]|uniref:hypothetical protein n=1 Tax=Undibacterium sp. SXout7W TaxID=3413049 RepID=UPI003BF38F64